MDTHVHVPAGLDTEQVVDKLFAADPQLYADWLAAGRPRFEYLVNEVEVPVSYSTLPGDRIALYCSRLYEGAMRLTCEDEKPKQKEKEKTVNTERRVVPAGISTTQALALLTGEFSEDDLYVATHTYTRGQQSPTATDLSPLMLDRDELLVRSRLHKSTAVIRCCKDATAYGPDPLTPAIGAREEEGEVLMKTYLYVVETLDKDKNVTAVSAANTILAETDEDARTRAALTLSADKKFDVDTQRIVVRPFLG